VAPRLSGIVDRRLDATLRARLTGFPVVVLAGARAVGKSVMLRQLADEAGVIIIDLDDLDTRALASADPATFVSGPAPVCIDEFQHVPQILDAIKAELNRRSGPGRFVLAGPPGLGDHPGLQGGCAAQAAPCRLWSSRPDDPDHQ
jgi:hypothetical protein